MDSDELDHIRELLYRYTQRLRALELKQALQGITTPVEILIEIEDLGKKIQRCQSQIDVVQKKFEPMPPILNLLERDDISDTVREKIEITFNGSFENVTPEIQNAVIRAIAGIVEISPSQVRVLKITAGSVIVLIELPTGAANTLLKLYEADDERIKEIDIQEIRLVSEKVLSLSKSAGSDVAGENAVQPMTVEDLAQRCARETDLYFNHQNYDSRYCFELFRRAIQSKDEQALEVLIVQYQTLVNRWVERWLTQHPDFSLFHDETQDIVAQAFERFWISFTPAKLDKSQSLEAVLRYLQMCAIGAVTDAWRKWRQIQFEQVVMDPEQEVSEPEPTAEDLVKSDEFWQLIRKKAKDPKEYRVMYASYYLQLSPREIFAEYPNEFDSIKELYQHKANFLERLARSDQVEDREIRSYLAKKEASSDK